MPYPYSWTPDRVVPPDASHVYVVASGQVPATLAVPVSVVGGTISLSFGTAGGYVIYVKYGGYVETCRVVVDTDGNYLNATPATSYGLDNGQYPYSVTAPLGLDDILSDLLAKPGTKTSMVITTVASQASPFPNASTIAMAFAIAL